MENYYLCECGKEFTDPQAFNGHKAHCKTHLGEGKYLKQLERNKKAAMIGSKKHRDNAKRKKEDACKRWIEEQHYCEHCGKLMLEKYGSGRFCSRTCANSKKHSEESKRKTSESIKKRVEEGSFKSRNSERARASYDSNPKFCVICNEKIPYEKRVCETCGKDTCIRKLLSLKCKLAHKEGRNKGWKSRNILSYPEQVWTDILIKNDIDFKSQFKVVNHEKRKYYFLDFLINDYIDLEIDGSQHLYPEGVKRDKERDFFIKSQGYLVFRIPRKGIKDSFVLKQQIDSLLSFIKSNPKPIS